MGNRIPDERADRGGLTGATGNLTSDQADEEFVPAETRELTDPAAGPHVPTPDDPAYRLEEHGEPPLSKRPAPGGEAELGGDELRDPEAEHL